MVWSEIIDDSVWNRAAVNFVIKNQTNRLLHYIVGSLKQQIEVNNNCALILGEVLVRRRGLEQAQTLVALSLGDRDGLSLASNSNCTYLTAFNGRTYQEARTQILRYA